MTPENVLPPSRGYWIGRWEAWLDRPESFVKGSWIKQAQDLDASQTRQELGSRELGPGFAGWTRFAALEATSDAFHLLKEELGLLPIKSVWSAGIQEPHARRIFNLAQQLECPGALLLAEDRRITFQELLRRLPSLRGEIVQPDFHSPEGLQQAQVQNPGNEHRWLEARAVGVFQRYGVINPLPISVAKRGPGANFDLSIVSDNGRLIVLEIMSGWWPKAWPSKRKLAERFAELGVLTVFIGAPPPWEPSGCHPSPRRLWTPSGVIIVGHESSGSGSPSTPFGPRLPGVYYLPEPELCDARGKPLFETILESAAVRVGG